MNILLDTDICIYAINGRKPEALARLRSYRLGDVGISAITYAELRFGVENSRRIEVNLERLERFLLPLEIMSFDAASGTLLRARTNRALPCGMPYWRQRSADSIPCPELERDFGYQQCSRIRTC